MFLWNNYKSCVVYILNFFSFNVFVVVIVVFILIVFFVFFLFFPCEPVATDLYLTFIKQEFKKKCFEAYYCYLPYLQLARVCYVYWLSKFVEYLDTVSKVDELPGS